MPPKEFSLALRPKKEKVGFFHRGGSSSEDPASSPEPVPQSSSSEITPEKDLATLPGVCEISSSLMVDRIIELGASFLASDAFDQLVRVKTDPRGEEEMLQPSQAFESANRKELRALCRFGDHAGKIWTALHATGRLGTNVTLGQVLEALRKPSRGNRSILEGLVDATRGVKEKLPDLELGAVIFAVQFYYWRNTVAHGLSRSLKEPADVAVMYVSDEEAAEDKDLLGDLQEYSDSILQMVGHAKAYVLVYTEGKGWAYRPGVRKPKLPIEEGQETRREPETADEGPPPQGEGSQSSRRSDSIFGTPSPEAVSQGDISHRLSPGKRIASSTPQTPESPTKRLRHFSSGVGELSGDPEFDCHSRLLPKLKALWNESPEAYSQTMLEIERLLER